MNNTEYDPSGLPIIPPLPKETPPKIPAWDGAIAICGECKLRIYRVMGYVCRNERCPCGLGPTATMGTVGFNESQREAPSMVPTLIVDQETGVDFSFKGLGLKGNRVRKQD